MVTHWGVAMVNLLMLVVTPYAYLTQFCNTCLFLLKLTVFLDLPEINAAVLKSENVIDV